MSSHICRRIETEVYVTEGKLQDELDTHKKYIVDDCRRVHNYDEFINTFISMLGTFISLIVLKLRIKLGSVP